MTPLLSVEAMTCAYGGIVAVRELSFQVGEGEIVALLGPNGAGKSTALRAISGMRRAQSGAITFAGKRVEKWPSHRVAGLGMSLVPEGRRLFTELSVDENLRMGGISAARATLDSRIAELCEIFPILKSRRAQKAGTLSGGEQQQLAIARALVSNPRLLVIDEMSLGLSPMVVADLYRTIRRVNQEGTAILLVEQQVALALTVAQRVYLIERGQVAREGPASDFGDTATVAAAYLGQGTAAALGAAAGEPADEPEPAFEYVKLPLRRGQARALQQLAAKEDKEVAVVVARAVDEFLAESTTKNGVTPGRKGQKATTGSGRSRSSERRSPPSPRRSPRRPPG